MVKEKVIIQDQNGLNAENATRFVQIASKYTSRIMIHYEDKEVNGKSIMSLLTLAVPPGDQLTIKIKGEDEEKALADLVHFLKTGQGDSYPVS
ncbi:MAG: HPr family phosphocarrier protein [Halanaerobiales bacterium]|nr:HPr family phosphocarrier protein [Halanaerobiales bacterium]